MPFTRSNTISQRSTDRPRPRKVEQPASPPRRNNTRKINVVSKASLAMLNPAYAMGIEAGLTWYEAHESDLNEQEALASPSLSASGSSQLGIESSSQWTMEPTPELEAFNESYEEDREEGGLGLILNAPTMERKPSNESVFEDDDLPIPSKRPIIAPINTSNPKSLSRLFTWKRTTKGGKLSSSPLSAPWEVPQSAPSHITSFDLNCHEAPSPIEATYSLPTTPLDNFTVPLPFSSIKKVLARKSSMPTLRDVRKASGSPLVNQKSFSPIETTVAPPFYWRPDAPRTPTLSTGHTFPSNTPSSSTTSKATPTRNNTRISSMGRGAARKSTVEAAMTPSIMIKAPKKKQRSDPWDLENMPPMPTSIHPSVASLIEQEKQDEKIEEEERQTCPKSTYPATSSEATSLPSIAIYSARRRSRSVDALPTSFTFNSGFSLADDHSWTQSTESEVETYQAIRFNVAGEGRGIIGTASPKLLPKKSPAMSSCLSPQRPSLLLQVVESPVVVNVMPPTPDLGAIEQETFQGAAASPSVRRSRSENEIKTLMEGYADLKYQTSQVSVLKGLDLEEGQDSDDESSLPYASGERFDEPLHRRSQSTVSEMSDSDSSMVSEFTDGNGEEPFGFARSMSSMSLSSEASLDSEMSDEGVACVSSAKIMSASSTVSSFSRPHLVSSPRIRDFSSWSSQSGSSNSGDTSMTSIASSTFSSKRSSKRLSGLPSLSSGQSLASVMTTSSSILDCGADLVRRGGEKSNLSSPVELQGQIEDGDCDTPRLSDGLFTTIATTTTTNTTKPLIVRKANGSQTRQIDYQQQGIYSPISRPFPRAHNATSPHLELDLSLPLDLHEIGLGFSEIDEVPKKREKPRVPLKSRARTTAAVQKGTGEPKTPPTTTRLLSSVMKEEQDNETFGLGLGLGLDSALQLQDSEDDVSQWRRRHQQTMTANRSAMRSQLGLAI